MPLIVEDIDAVARRLGRPVLMVRFGQSVVDWVRDTAVKAKREEFLRRLDREGVAWTPCGPPESSGWLSYLGDIYLDLAYTPGEPEYERLRSMMEDEVGQPLDPQIRFYVYR